MIKSDGLVLSALTGLRDKDLSFFSKITCVIRIVRINGTMTPTMKNMNGVRRMFSIFLNGDIPF
jgi:hypothetical protein